MKLQNKSAVISGGSRGIGKVVARVFVREGARVLLVSRSKDELDSASRDLGGGGVSVFTCVADVSREDDVKKVAKAARDNFGGVDVLVNAAGIYGPIGPSLGVDFHDWKKTFEINVFGTFSMIQFLAPFMAEKKYGKIVNFSGGGDGPLPRFSAYNASKVAVVRLTETLAAELRKSNIDVNAVAPGPVNTKFLDQALAAGRELVGEKRYTELLKQKETGGVSPEKTAELCVFLASEASNGLSGKLLSAAWDDWKNWDKNRIDEIMKSDAYTLRRLKS